MSQWASIALLINQALLTVIGIEALRRRVFSAVHSAAQPALIVDVWAPLILIVPMMFTVGRSGASVHGIGWLWIGGPIVCGVLGLGIALAASVGWSWAGARSAGPGSLAHIVWTGAGIVLLLLGAAHDLTMWMGQCAFVSVAMLLWLNTPDDQDGQPARESQAQSSAAGAMLVALLCAIGQGIMAYLVADQWSAVSGALMIAGAAAALSAAAVLAGGAAALRIGGWAAAYGVLLGLGLLSAIKLAPLAWRVLVEGQRGAPLKRIAYGFGEYWIEALLLMALGSAAVGTARLHPTVRRVLGVVAVVGAATLAAWRLSRI